MDVKYNNCLNIIAHCHSLNVKNSFVHSFLSHLTCICTRNYCSICHHWPSITVASQTESPTNGSDVWSK